MRQLLRAINLFSIILLPLLYITLVYQKDYHVIYDEEVTISVNKEYNDNGINACYGSLVKCNLIDYKSDGNVDTTKLGDYTINYDLGNDKIVTKTIHVVDLEKPTITIDGELKICKNFKILTNNYTVTDNYDTDLTDKVLINQVDNKYYLEVSDSSNNKESIEVNPEIVEDNIEITIKGGETYTKVGTSYKESGYTATSLCNGDLTDLVKVSNNVNTNKVGSYKVNYSLEYEGNTYSKDRNVTVYSQSGKKIVYLTFDDGPSSYTKSILDILDKYDVKATFFVTNQFPAYQNMIGEEYKRGHSIAVHTYSHNYKTIYSSVDNYFNDLYKMNDIIYKQTGIRTKLVRFPGGSSNTVSRSYSKGVITKIAERMSEEGFKYFDWNNVGEDCGSCANKNNTDGAKCVYKNVVGNLKSNETMVLLHDIKKMTVNALEDIIKFGLDNGYTFKPITEDTYGFHLKIAN